MKLFSMIFFLMAVGSQFVFLADAAEKKTTKTPKVVEKKEVAVKTPKVPSFKKEKLYRAESGKSSGYVEPKPQKIPDELMKAYQKMEQEKKK